MTGVPASAAGGTSSANGAPASAGSGAASGGASSGAMSGSVSGGLPSGGVSAGDASSGGAPAGGGSVGSASLDSASVGSASSGVLESGLPDGPRPARGAKVVAAAVNQASVWNIANFLTMLRLLLVPGFVALMLADGGYDPAMRSFAWAAFAIAMITDLFDGHLARTYDLVTDFGKIADPIADKAIMGAALICLSSLGDLPWWVTVVILGRELGITLLRFLVIRYGVIPASRGGKLKTLTQGVAVGMYVLALTGWLATLRFWVMAAAVVLTVLTGLDYVRQAIVLRRQGIAERMAASEETEA
ncbi:CDP-diacylglycerol--glycerol-3-phosphate 3-phosphatidyltransferase [Streptomyces sp. NBC_01261]|uniref:CDP-diacylglycerol--glycerol-3-phosphate 3-phosphatidyltransferase n=1 Tax=unclassified Streptomyces TaxID=2593676 RepID=UPI002E2B38A3|nr:MULTISPECIES: CDP-diacylglycerol--glycerol-3-phosphate 3-phosphatidyltransferase [unclassified Streptomyces]